MRSPGALGLVPLAGLLLAAPIAGAGDVPADAVIATLPFLDVPEPNRIYVDLARPDSPPFPLLLDTGATHAVMTPLAARAAGVSVRTLKSTAYRRSTRLGRDVQFYVDTRTSDTGSKTGAEFGVLGGDFLKHFVFEIDTAARAVRFLDPKRASLAEASAASGEAIVPLRDSARPIVDVTIGDHTLAVIADTGAPWPVVLSGAAARSAGIDVDALPAFMPMQTVSGEVDLHFYEAPELAIGGFRFANVPILIAPKGIFGLGAEGNDSVIGYDLLSRFLMRFDYDAQRLWLRRQSEQVLFAGVDAALSRTSGAYLHPIPSGAYVVAVLPDTPAAERGLRPGDFLAFEGGARDPETLLRKLSENRSVRVIRTENGESRDVDLAVTAKAR